MTKPLLMVVDDDPKMLDVVAEVGELSGFKVLALSSVADFQQAWAENAPSVIVMDIVMPDMDGNELLMWLGERKYRAPIILMSGYDGKHLGLAECLGTTYGDTIIGKLAKPFKINDLEALLKKALV